jgi:hypothetical protein
MNFDKYSYYLGMTFAFIECVVNDAKEIAFTHPLLLSEYTDLKSVTEQMVKENNIHIYWDHLPTKIIGILYKYEESILKYKKLRETSNPIDHFDNYKDLLGYD